MSGTTASGLSAEVVARVSAEVTASAAALVAAFGSHDTRAYFASFDAAATFLFHSSPALLGSRAAYEAEWAAWEAEGFRVLGCSSGEPRVDVLGPDVAVFTHRVRTEATFDGGPAQVLDERETIVFRRDQSGRWLGIHEHLSPDPSPPGAAC